MSSSTSPIQIAKVGLDGPVTGANENSEANRMVVNLTQRIVQDAKSDNDNGDADKSRTMMHLSSATVGSTLSQNRPLSVFNFKASTSTAWKSPQLLHKRISNLKLKEVPTNEFIMNKTLDDIALSCNIPQWLIYSWTSKAKDKSLVDRKTQQAVAELLILKQYALPVSLCLSLSSSQQDAAAKNLLILFRHINKVMTRSTQSTPSLALRSEKDLGSTASSLDNTPSAVPKLQKDTIAQEKSIVASPISNRRRDHLIGFLEALIIEEVTEAKTESTLFRSNNIVSKILSSYASFVAKDYLHSCLFEVVTKVINLGSMEVDPLKLDPAPPGAPPIDNQELLASNMTKLLGATKDVLNAIISSSEMCPVGLKKLCFLIQKQVEQKFSKVQQNTMSQDKVFSPMGDTHTSITQKFNGRERQVAVSGFIFLRYICPSIVSADTFGLITTPVQPRQRRNLILVSKIIQNIANGIKFGSKEGYMIPANQFVEDNEPLLVKYCDAIQMIDPDTVYLTDESESGSSKPPEEFDTALLQTMQSFNAQMDKMLERLQRIHVNEIMTYTVFGALKCILKRFETVEKQMDMNMLHDQKPTTSLVSFSDRDNQMMDNFVLLGGLEEILLMNRCVLIYALMSPSSFYDATNDGQHDSLLISKMAEVLTRAAIQVIGPHGGYRLYEITEWVVDQELKLRQRISGGEGAASHRSVIMQNLLIFNPGDSKMLEKNGTLLASKLVASFFVAFGRDFLRSILTDFCHEVQESKLRYEIDPERLVQEDVLKTNLENLMNFTKKLLSTITGSVMPDGMRLMIRYLFRELSGRSTKEQSEENSNVEDSELTSANYLVCYLFLRIFCPMIANPSAYNITIEYTVIPGDSAGDILDPATSSERLFVLVSYMLRFICTHISNPDFRPENNVEPSTVNSPPAVSPLSGESSATVDAESKQYEKDMLAPLIQQWNLCVINLMRAVLKEPVPVTNLSATNISIANSEYSQSDISLERSKSKRNHVIDPPLSVSTSSRAKGILTFRKFLNEDTIRRLKTIINTKEFKQTSKSMTVQDMVKKAAAATETPITHTDELHGLRVETIHYRLLDRVRIIFLSIYKDNESLSNRVESDSTVPNSVIQPVKSRQSVTVDSGKRSEANRAVGESKGKKSIGGSANPTPISKSIAQATRNMVRNIFSIRATANDAAEDLIDGDVKPKATRRNSSGKPEKTPAPVDRGIMGMLRANRKEEIPDSRQKRYENGGEGSSALVDFEWEEGDEKDT